MTVPEGLSSVTLLSPGAVPGVPLPPFATQTLPEASIALPKQELPATNVRTSVAAAGAVVVDVPHPARAAIRTIPTKLEPTRDVRIGVDVLLDDCWRIITKPLAISPEVRATG